MQKNGCVLKQKAYDFIKEKIVRCEYLPEADISEDLLVSEMGISRTPIREALIKLENENLVNIYPRKGIFVASISVKVINDVFQIREIVEPQVLKLVINNLNLQWLKDIRIRIQNGAGDSGVQRYYEELDRDFHSYLVNSCSNVYLTQLMDNIFAHNQRIRTLSFKYSNRREITKNEHIEIIDALLDKDIEKAQSSMKTHLMNAKTAAFNLTILT